MLATRWNPWQDLFDMERQLGSLTRSFFGGQRDRNGRDTVVPVVDTLTRGDDIVVRAELPGVDPEKDIDVALQDNVLRIRGERRLENRTDGEDYVRMESSYGSFERTIPLPEGIDADDIKASYDRGILEVVVPGAARETTPKRIPVASGDQRRELTATAND
jgi:HSP20 family protein